MTVGHEAILHGCAVADDCLIGMGAKNLNGAVLESECLLGAGALINDGKHFERGALYYGAADDLTIVPQPLHLPWLRLT